MITPKTVFVRFQQMPIRGTGTIMTRPYATLSPPMDSRPGKWKKFISLERVHEVLSEHEKDPSRSCYEQIMLSEIRKDLGLGV